ncbi:MAG: peptide chain release factor N(5)-glutamine methyltransferase [Bdellovibrionales bacterium]|nr:peptide chain release factor N(5)-glutamine methyltransferase [Bdellovibrionales bacterium]
MKYSDLAQLGKRRLSRASIQCADPMLHMKQIMEHLLQVDSARLAMWWDEEITDPAFLDQVEIFLKRREAGEPFQYIVGEEWFWQSRFEVGPGVFIPRKETEILVETLLEEVCGDFVKVGELGAGSGNIGITVLQERPSWEWHAFEINPETLPFTEKNRRSLLSPSCVYRLHAGDFFERAIEYAPYDGMVSNPPYIRDDEMALLPAEVRREPELALRGGAQGLDLIDRWIAALPTWLRPGGWFITEIDFRQADALQDRLSRAGFGEIRVVDDYSHRPRVVFARRRGGGAKGV